MDDEQTQRFVDAGKAAIVDREMRAMGADAHSPEERAVLCDLIELEAQRMGADLLNMQPAQREAIAARIRSVRLMFSGPRPLPSTNRRLTPRGSGW